MENEQEWWSEESGFFGPFYMKADTMRDSDANNEKSLEERTQEEVDGIVRLLDLDEGAKVLDCPCGYGRHSIELASRGFQVTGVDINTAHLERARDQNESEFARFQKANMLNLDYQSEFDAVINIFASFGFFDREEENEKVLANFFDALKPGGSLLIHTDANVPQLDSGPNEYTNTKELETGETLKIKDKYDPKTRRINGSWTIKDGKEEKTRSYSVRIYPKYELEDMCVSAGFTSVFAFSNWKGETYSEESTNTIIVSEK